MTDTNTYAASLADARDALDALDAAVDAAVDAADAVARDIPRQTNELTQVRISR